ncbi:MAG: carboxypeptidase-like regulatory domain-containing protein [Pirellulaceae bacterium]
MQWTFLGFVVLTCGCVGSWANAAETIAGSILDRDGTPVAGALVIVCDGGTGIPVGRDFKPFAEGRKPTEMVVAVSDDSGGFRIPNAQPGTYRLLAQSWEDAAKPLTHPLEVNGQVVRLRGLAERVVVPSAEAGQIEMRPCGTARLTVMAEPRPGNDETLLVVSRQPLAADAILGFAAWSGAFMPGMIAANRMPLGRTTFLDLPEGSAYLAAFAADNIPGFGSAACDLKSNRSVASVVPLIAAWSDGHKTPPPTLVELVAKVRTIPPDELRSLVEQQYPNVAKLRSPSEGPRRDPWIGLIPDLDKPVKLPDGTTVPLKDLMAAEAYVRLEDHDRARRNR